jgi:hypothetical protein
VTDLRTRLGELIGAAAAGRGSASVSVLEPAAGELQAFWVPESTDEPAFLAYAAPRRYAPNVGSDANETSLSYYRA